MQKLTNQLSAGVTGGGGKRTYDTVGAGSWEFGRDGRKENGEWDVRSAVGARNQMGLKGVGDVGVSLGVRVGKREGGGKGEGGGKIKEERSVKRVKVEGRGNLEPFKAEVEEEAICALASQKSESTPTELDAKATPPQRGIFTSLTFYINGSTAPLVSDHRLKYLIVEHGGAISIGLGRRTVTHVILGQANGYGGEGGAGGGLSGGKIEKEIRRVRGCGVKYVGVEWVLESIKRGKRVGEAGFVGVSTAPRGVRSVYGMFKKGEGSGKEPEREEK